MMARTCISLISGRVMPRRHAAQAEHRVASRACSATFLSRASFSLELRRACCPGRAAPLPRRAAPRRTGRNSCSGGSMSRMIDRQAVHRPEDALEVLLLDREELVEGVLARLGVRRWRGSSAARSAGARPRRTCARCGRGRCPRRRTRGPLRRRAGSRRSPRRPGCRIASAQPRSGAHLVGHLGLDHRDRAEDDLAGRAVDGDVVAFLDHGAVDVELARSRCRP